MSSEDQGLYGIFKEELKNRFLCRVQIEGEDAICYIPSSCRLSNFIDMTNREVLLRPIESVNARTKYGVFAVKYGGRYIPLNLAKVNQVLESEIHRSIFAFLGKRKVVTKEKLIDGYKSDLFIVDSNTIIEIKSILSFDKAAIFPTVYSERAINQLQALSKLLHQGYRVCYIFVALNSLTRSVKINDRIMQFDKGFRECLANGMQSRAFSIQLKDNMMKIKQEIIMKI